MRRFLKLLFELASGLPLVAVGFWGAWSLLQSQTLVYLLFPSLSVVAGVLGLWRGRASTLPSWQVLVLLNLPLFAVVLRFVSARSLLLYAFPLVATIFSLLGLSVARSGLSRNRRRLAFLLPLVGVNVVLVVLVPRFVTSFIASEELHEPAPPFLFTLLEGGTTSTPQMRGEVVVLDFWATWCVPCRRELPELERIRQRFERRPGVAFYAVDTARGDNPEEAGDTPEQARQFLRQGGYRLTAAYDTAGSAQRTFSISRLPALVVLDRGGRIRLRHQGFIGSEDLGAKLGNVIEKLLTEPGSP
ncbi:MAG TPA: TlpA disulfide reductase family protein [Thermoanaerobaculia bacterium]|nr:TlpA disulfide reductase family protein [Thermoanaerobaculia bacterium]